MTIETLTWDAQAFQFPDTEKYGWMPELVGGEWIKEDEE